MNTNTLRKNYDKLTAPERFAASIAAAIRDDASERRALLDSAPEITLTFPHTIGLHEGFRDLTLHHITRQLGTAGMFWMLMYMAEDEKADAVLNAMAEGETQPNETARTLTARRFMEGLEAYRAVCVEYGIDPEPLMEAYNDHPLLLGMAETIFTKAFELSHTELIDLEETKQAYRKIIEDSRAHWAEAKAKGK